MARPPIEIDPKQLEALMRLMPTAKDCAAFFKCSVDTIERRIQEFTTDAENPEGLSFADFREQNMVHTRMKLVRTALKEAEEGNNVMLIFCLKNLCGWKDKQPGENDMKLDVNNVTALPDEVLDARIAHELAKISGGNES